MDLRGSYINRLNLSNISIDSDEDCALDDPELSSLVVDALDFFFPAAANADLVPSLSASRKEQQN